MSSGLAWGTNPKFLSKSKARKKKKVFLGTSLTQPLLAGPYTALRVGRVLSVRLSLSTESVSPSIPETK